jgi:hypothetical protein
MLVNTVAIVCLQLNSYTTYAQVNVNKLIDGFVNISNNSSGLNPSEGEKKLQRDVVKYVIFSDEDQFRVIRNDVERIFNNPSTYSDTYVAEKNIQKMSKPNIQEMNKIVNSAKGGSYSLGNAGYKITIPFLGNIIVEKELGDILVGAMKPNYNFYVPKDAVKLFDKEYDGNHYSVSEVIIANNLNGQKQSLSMDRSYKLVGKKGKKYIYDYYFTLKYNDQVISLSARTKEANMSDPTFYKRADHRDIGPFTVSWDYIRYQDSDNQWITHAKDRIIVFYRYNDVQAHSLNTTSESKSTSTSTSQKQELNGNSSSNRNISVMFQAQVIKQKAFFYSEGNESTIRKAFCINGDIVDVHSNSGNYYYVTYTNRQGIRTSGYMKKSDLKRVY